MPRWLASLSDRSNSLRPRALRPQLKRDPLGANRLCLMTKHCVLRLAPVVAAVLIVVACHPSAPVLDADLQAIVCYRLDVGAWTSAYKAPFAKAAVGLVSPLPDTIVLTRKVITAYGRAYFVAARVPTDSTHPAGTWTQVRSDTLVVDFPSDVGDRLFIRLHSSGTHLEGVTWVAPDLHTAGMVLYDPVGPPAPWAPVTATQVQCSASTVTSPPGA